MFKLNMFYFVILLFFAVVSLAGTQNASLLVTDEIEDDCVNIDDVSIPSFIEFIIPALEGKRKGDAGKIAVIGGSTEYTGAPYFAAISALKVGADLVYVITTKSAAPVIKCYSPDLIVYPYLHKCFINKIVSLLPKMDVIVIGPGLGRESETITLIYDIIRTCKVLKKPLVIDADGLYALAKNISIIKEYPSPGIILTPNHIEADRLMKSVPNNITYWFKFWGENVSVLVKGQTDTFYSNAPFLEWHIFSGGSGRRAAGQGDILAGSLGTFFYWTLKTNLCVHKYPVQLSQSLAAYAAANLTRTCNAKAYTLFGRSLLASDMVNQIHNAFEFIITHV